MLDPRIRCLKRCHVGIGSVQVDHVRLLGKERIDLPHLDVQRPDVRVGRLQFIRHHMLESCKPFGQRGQDCSRTTGHGRRQGDKCRAKCKPGVLRVQKI